MSEILINDPEEFERVKIETNRRSGRWTPPIRDNRFREVEEKPTIIPAWDLPAGAEDADEELEP